MHILLVGEYSGLHNALKAGLSALGHRVTLLGEGDAFKKYPVDVDISPRFFGGTGAVMMGFRKAMLRVFGFDPVRLENGLRFFRLKKRFRGFDVVQLINENALNTFPKWERKAVKFLRKHNKKLFLLSCGEDFYNVTYMMEHPTSYSILTPYFEDPSLKKEFYYTLKYRSAPYRKLSEYIYEHIDGIIASDLDYHVPLVSVEKYKGLIPNPVNTDAIRFHPVPTGNVIRIFHGINDRNYRKKGNRWFEAALAIVLKKYPGKVRVKTARSLPYETYIRLYDDCHIVLDQVYSRDQGYNALEAMAKGKVVFTGAGEIFTDYYRITEPVAVNALPDVDYLVERLSWLIEHPEEIAAMGKRARAFVEQYHYYRDVAGKYVEMWGRD